MSTLLARRVRAVLDELGLEAFLRKSGVSRSTLYEILRGESEGRHATLRKLSAAGVDLDGVFGPPGRRKNSRAA